MAKPRAFLNGAREVLALGALAAQLAMVTTIGSMANFAIDVMSAVIAHGRARTILAIGALLAMYANTAAATQFTHLAPLPMHTNAAATTILAIVAQFGMGTDGGAATVPALGAPLIMFTKAGATTVPALVVPPAMRTLLVYLALDCMRGRRRRWHSTCWTWQSCHCPTLQRHGHEGTLRQERQDS